MPRRIRFFGKKRGERRTGAGWTGRAGQILLFAALLVGGGVLLAWLAGGYLLPEWRANRHFVAHTCRVVMQRVGEREGDSGTVYRPEVVIHYEVDGREYETTTWSIATLDDGGYSHGKADQEALLADYPPGRELPCWYDPANPARAVLVRSWSWGAWIMLLLPASFLIVGGGGLGYALLNWGRSAERRAALRQQAEQAVPRDLFDEADDDLRGFPYVPSEGNLTNSPGVRLAYRLPMAGSTGWALTGLIVGCLAWNGMVALFATMAAGRHVAGDPAWSLTALVVPFALAGVALAWHTVREALAAARSGVTLMEISEHPLYPGGTYQIFLAQAGRRTLNSLDVLLVCQEKATYQQGTNTRTEVRRVYEQPLLRREPCDLAPGRPYEADAELLVPNAAMHSFRAGHNEIGWVLVVRGDGGPGIAYEREFPVVVYPAAKARAPGGRR